MDILSVEMYLHYVFAFMKKHTQVSHHSLSFLKILELFIYSIYI